MALKGDNWNINPKKRPYFFCRQTFSKPYFAIEAKLILRSSGANKYKKCGPKTTYCYYNYDYSTNRLF